MEWQKNSMEWQAHSMDRRDRFMKDARSLGPRPSCDAASTASTPAQSAARRFPRQLHTEPGGAHPWRLKRP
eukprot:3539756-Rhodomonas_salina.1